MNFLAGLGRQLRVDSVRATAAANSGHPPSSISAAADALQTAGVSARVIDLYSIKPFGDGHQAPRLTKFAVHTMPGSAHPDEQLRAAGIDAKSIEAAAVALLSSDRGYD
jgi:transketolase